MEVVFTVMWLIYAFWMGHEVGLRRERKSAASAREIARCFIAQAKHIKKSRQFIGAGPTITNATVWTIGEIGKFKITVEEEA